MQISDPQYIVDLTYVNTLFYWVFISSNVLKTGDCNTFFSNLTLSIWIFFSFTDTESPRHLYLKSKFVKNSGLADTDNDSSAIFLNFVIVQKVPFYFKFYIQWFLSSYKL